MSVIRLHVCTYGCAVLKEEKREPRLCNSVNGYQTCLTVLQFFPPQPPPRSPPLFSRSLQRCWEVEHVWPSLMSPAFIWLCTSVFLLFPASYNCIPRSSHANLVGTTQHKQASTSISTCVIMHSHTTQVCVGPHHLNAQHHSSKPWRGRRP